MKKLDKLNINPAKLIKAEELKEFKGGWTGPCATWQGGHYTGLQTVTCEDGWSAWQCDTYCRYATSSDDCFCNFAY